VLIIKAVGVIPWPGRLRNSFEVKKIYGTTDPYGR